MLTFLQAVKEKYVHVAGSQDGGELVGGDLTGRKQALDVLARVFVPGLSINSPGDGKDVAHKKPLSKGGSNKRSNLKVTSKSKNRSFKRTKTARMA